MYDDDLFRALPQAEDLRHYIERGRPVNHFLTAVLENDLMAAFARADAGNKAALENYLIWLKSYAPIAAYGGAENVAAWIARGGIEGR